MFLSFTVASEVEKIKLANKKESFNKAILASSRHAILKATVEQEQTGSECPQGRKKYSFVLCTA